MKLDPDRIRQVAAKKPTRKFVKSTSLEEVHQKKRRKVTKVSGSTDAPRPTSSPIPVPSAESDQDDIVQSQQFLESSRPSQISQSSI